MPEFLKPGVAAWLAAATTLCAFPASAEDEYVFNGSKIRTNMSNTLVMLAEQASAASCKIKTGLNAEDAREELESVRNDFRLILDGLENGSPALGIPSGETSGRILRRIQAVEDIWAEVDGAIDAMASGDPDATSTAIRLSQVPLHEATYLLASDILNHYSDPHEMTQRDALSLNFAGRQRMLGYKMTRSLCGMYGGMADVGSPEELDEFAELFDVTLAALQTGMPAAGLQPPPSDLAAEMLAQAGAEWTEVRPAVQEAVETGAVTNDTLQAMEAFVSDTKLLMGNTVTVYMLSSGESEHVSQVALENYAKTEVPKWLSEPILIDAIREQNARHASLTQADIDQLDLDWRAEMKEGGGPLVQSLVDRPLSDWFRERVGATAGLVVEIFAIDNRGLNVGQSGVTGDYWQGDEAKYEQTIKNGRNATHFGETHLDVENGVYQAQISAPVPDPETGEPIGVMIFSVNVQSLL
ncbi:type IV pili methyl-accepting chemotaxis transducer N-terminal domain-containing protein [Jannaschia aquimarina]|uniref:NarX-like N-terminal domain-containing protein n=1 Tax=Jannaschia aquimarina TaxID=935700 RepID=A0A0D1DAD1_9RHOB|nr:type IV pili methyl-accepting chemotaxis transducer N-terminal domain-containing protein [Jannaschia aquimarina]KIT16868.1 hypothetical protein jaqu_13660 [Jannaschia aquimarina]SNT12694.1 Type IV pili methyl-accepting chemotaxis transducer N-term [Jannaschia aquimarina]